MNRIVAVLVVSAVTGAASADWVSFQRITNNGNTNVASQLSMNVTDAGWMDGRQLVDFTIYNNVGTQSSVTGVYFADGTLFDLWDLFEGNDVDFTEDDPADWLPGGGNDWHVTHAFSTGADPAPPQNGINESADYLTVRFKLFEGKTIADTLAALSDGSLRVGLHIQAIAPQDGSDSYANLIVPAPGAVLLGVFGLGIAGWVKRRMA